MLIRYKYYPFKNTLLSVKSLALWKHIHVNTQIYILCFKDFIEK